MIKTILSVASVVFCVSFLSVAPLLISGCGKQVCVAGFGDCSELSKFNGKTTGSSGDLRLKADKTTVFPNERVTVTATGGQTPYKITVTAGPCTVASTGNDNAQIVAGTAGACTIRVTDFNNLRYEMAIQVQTVGT